MRPYHSMGIIILGIVGLLWTDSHSGHLLGFILTVVTITSGLGLCWMGWGGRRGRKVPTRSGVC